MRKLNKKENSINKRQKRGLKELDVNLNVSTRQLCSNKGGACPVTPCKLTK